jgi:hypothetical protein
VIPIDEWWPLLDEQIRRWMVNNFWSPVAPYSLAEIARLGGPGEDDPYWTHRDRETYLPSEAVQWIISSPDFEQMSMPKKPDPRAAYFRRGWPHRHN